MINWFHLLNRIFTDKRHHASYAQVRTFQRFYRKMQIIRIAFNDIFSGWIIISYFGVVLLLISLSFVLVRLRLRLGMFLFFILVAVDVIMTIISALIFKLFLNFPTYAACYIHEAKKCSRSKMETKFINSCQTIQINVGGFFTFYSKNFCLHTYGTVILETTINLLLTF